MRSNSHSGPTVGESLSKARDQVGYIDTIQAHSLSCLTLVHKELGCRRGCFLPRRHNVTQTYGSSSGDFSTVRSNELKDGGREAWERRCDHGKRRSTSTSGTLEVVQRGRGKVRASTSPVDQGAMKRKRCLVPSNTVSGSFALS